MDTLSNEKIWLGAAGIMFTALVGYWVWKRQQRQTRRGALLDERAKAYKELWEKLEDIHVRLRGNEKESQQFSQHVRDVNAFAMKNALRIDEEDRTLAARYLETVYGYCSIINGSKDGEVILDGFETSEIPPDMLDRVARLGPAQNRMQQLRGEVIARFKAVIENER